MAEKEKHEEGSESGHGGGHGGGGHGRGEDAGKGRTDAAIRPADFSSLGGTIEFDDDSSTISTRGQQRLQEIAAKLKGIRFAIEVRGHASPSETMHDVERGIGLSHARALA